jgi:hypothetical protein
VQPVPTHVSQPGSAYGVPHDPWQGWACPDGANGSPASGHQAPTDSGPTSPWARPSEPSVDDDTDDLSAVLWPLWAAGRPPAR